MVGPATGGQRTLTEPVIAACDEVARRNAAARDKAFDCEQPEMRALMALVRRACSRDVDAQFRDDFASLRDVAAAGRLGGYCPFDREMSSYDRAASSLDRQEAAKDRIELGVLVEELLSRLHASLRPGPFGSAARTPRAAGPAVRG